jgi:hypothetical protein
MNTIQFDCGEHRVDVPNELAGPFIMLALLKDLEVSQLFDFNRAQEFRFELVHDCFLAASMSIGVQFAGSKQLKPAFEVWWKMPFHTKVDAVVQARDCVPASAYKAVFDDFIQKLSAE